MGLRNRASLEDKRFFFVTTTFIKWLHLLTQERHFKLITTSLDFVCQKYHARICGYVLMPSHIHLLVYFEEQNRLSPFMRDFKKYTSTRLRQMVERERPELLAELRSKEAGRRFQVWMNRYDDVWIETRRMAETKLKYIHINPVKAGLADVPDQYPHSSCAFYEVGAEGAMSVLHYMEVV